MIPMIELMPADLEGIRPTVAECIVTSSLILNDEKKSPEKLPLQDGKAQRVDNIEIREWDLQVHAISVQAKLEEFIERSKPVVELEEVVLEASWPERFVRLGTRLPDEIRVVILKTPRKYKV
nr:uncharacterized protein LOC109189889 [Ipomoea batatas]